MGLMFLFLSKSLPPLIYPTGLVCALIVLAIFLKQGNWQRRVLLIAFLILWLGSNYWVANGLVKTLERQVVPPPVLPQAPVIVVLGGGTLPAISPRPISEVSEAGDRLLYAAWLYQQGIAPTILITGGGIDWMGSVESETVAMADILQLAGVPADAIWTEPDSVNTYENARFTREILQNKGINTIILVTSAMHMPRSVRLFEQQGFEVIPAPTDYLVSEADQTFFAKADIRSHLIHLLPDAKYLYWNSLAIKEYIGAAVYRLRGWI